MSVRKLFLSAALVAGLVGAMPARASADWLFTPYVGGVFGGNANFGDFNNFEDECGEASDVWRLAGVDGRRHLRRRNGSRYTPNFFEDTAGDGDFAFGDSNVTTLMGNLILGIPVGGQHGAGIRPYVSGGVGLLRSRADGGDFFDDLDTNDFGMNIGAGLHGFFTDSVGIRGDVHPPFAAGQRTRRRVRPCLVRLQFLARYRWRHLPLRHVNWRRR